MNVDQQAFAIVSAMIRNEQHIAAEIVCAIDLQRLREVTVTLAETLGQAWMELCEIDSVDFDEFMSMAGLGISEE